MERVIYTQRVERIESYGERRDCADQRIADFIAQCGFLPIPLPNRGEFVASYIKELNPAGMILTGGNSLAAYGGDAPERDEMDRQMITLAIKEKIPLYGFCRGMQSILDYFGNELNEVEGHVAVQHEIQLEDKKMVVNSYHRQACVHLKEESGLIQIGATKDGVIEAVQHRNYPIIGTMWHPERQSPYSDFDKNQVQKLFKQKKGFQ